MSPDYMMIGSLLVAAALGTLALVLVGSVHPERSRSLANLQRGQRAVSSSVITRPSEGVEAFARRVTLPTLVALLERQHARAGRPADWTVGRLLVLKLLWVPVAAALLLLALASSAAPILILVAILIAILIYFLPDLLLLSRGQERDQRIQIELADTLDQMTIAVEAGLGFDAAMSRAAKNGKGALADELMRTLQDIRMGRSRQQAFEDLAKRNDVPDLRQFVRAILQADAFGISIGDVLRTQAAEMRMKRRQRAEEKAQQVPVNVIFPLIACILPALFIVVMGPAAIGIIEMFGSMSS